MGFLSIIRRWHKREHVPIREISRRLGVSRNTIRKYLRSELVEPKFQIPDRPSKLDPYAEKLSAWLRREENRSRKQRRTVKQLYGDLVSLGYDGSYNRVAAFARAWKEECRQVQRTVGRGTFVPLAFGPGEAFQFDWSEDFAVIGSTRTKLQVAHSKLCHSRAFIVRAYPYKHMRCCSTRIIDGFVEYTKRVSSTCLIHLDRNRYSVPASFANRPVSLRVYPSKLVVVAEGQILCEHPRIVDRTHNGPGRTIYDWRHYLAVIQRKPGALRNGAPFLELPEAFKRLQQHLLRRPGGDREMVEVLALVLHHDEQAGLVAVELALEDSVPSKTHILNRLHRLVDSKTTPPVITAPQALTLANEPKADVERYDTLRQISEVRHAS